MNKNLTVSLNISTYNWPGALKLCLMSVAKQKVLPTEVVIADDGSGQLTRDLIADFQRDFPVPIKHIWHPDDGFKLSEIRNKGIAASTGDYIIQVDGDLILHPHFIADHINFSRPNTFVTGSRVMLDKALSEELIKNECVTINYFTKGLQNRSNGLRSRFLRDHIMAGYRRNDIYFMRGCNMAFWKQDLLRVNGYNEEFTGWGREDNELAARLINAGLLKRVIKFSAVVYHLYHEQNSRGDLSQNDQLLKETIRLNRIECARGIKNNIESK